MGDVEAVRDAHKAYGLDIAAPKTYRLSRAKTQHSSKQGWLMRTPWV